MLLNSLRKTWRRTVRARSGQTQSSHPIPNRNSDKPRRVGVPRWDPKEIPQNTRMHRSLWSGGPSGCAEQGFCPETSAQLTTSWQTTAVGCTSVAIDAFWCDLRMASRIHAIDQGSHHLTQSRTWKVQRVSHFDAFFRFFAGSGGLACTKRVGLYLEQWSRVSQREEFEFQVWATHPFTGPAMMSWVNSSQPFVSWRPPIRWINKR